MPKEQPITEFSGRVADADATFRQYRTSRYPIAFVLKITSDLAEYMLRFNRAENRSVGEKRSLHYRRLIRDGYWMLNGETIIVDWAGHVMNGQHRLIALAQSPGAYIETVVVFGIDPAAFATLDNGARRSVADVLHSSGEQGSHTLGAVASLYWRYQRNIHTYYGVPYPAALDVQETIEQFPSLRESARRARLTAIRRLLAPSVAGCAHFIFSTIDPILADRFYDDLESGADLESDNPVLQVRSILLGFRAGKGKREPHEQMANLIKAWNLYYTGRRVKRLQWNRNEGFPQVAGDENREIIPVERYAK